MDTRGYLSKIAEIKIRLDRGNSLIYWIKNIMILTASIKIILEIGTKESILFGIAGVLIVFAIGWLDLNKIKLFQKEQELTTGKYNPYFKKKFG